jgi:prepilin-type N-terminal cleavage/methylation domain-containing protein
MKRAMWKSESGFTIVELMIALSVLSVLLITATVVLIQIGGLYAKGVNAADLQNVNRNVVADITGQLQFSGTPPNGCTDITNNVTCYTETRNITVPKVGGGTIDIPVYSYCIGKTRYSYVINHKLGVDSYSGEKVPHVLWRDTMTDTSRCKPVDILNGTDINASPSSGDGYEMLGSNMRLTRFDIQQVSGSNGVYGIQVWMAFGDNDLIHTQADGASTCSGGIGTQFCAISSISTQVTGRVY